MHLIVDSSRQEMHLLDGAKNVRSFLISTGKNGMGEQYGSEKTPRGLHQIRAKIGAGAKANTIFVGRRATGEIYQDSWMAHYPSRDWILTRILWLSGLELGKNRLGSVDTMRRYIYIHGTPDCVKMGEPGSRGCIRMKNNDIIWLFDHVKIGTRLEIL